MKKGVILALCAALVMPVMAGVCSFSDTKNIWTNIGAGVTWYPNSVSWNHTIPDEAVDNMLTGHLTITAWNFDLWDDFVSIKLNGYDLGALTGSISTFTLSDAVLDSFSDTSIPATATITFTWSHPWDCGDDVKILTSTLCGTYECPPHNGVIPAPGAVILAGIGTTMVGWLRRRRVI